MSLFSSDKKTRIGIDIGTAALKIVELTKEANRFRLTNYGLFELEPGSEALNVATQSSKGGVTRLSDQDIVWGIKTLLQKTQIKSRDAVASIPSFPTFATTITLPYLSDEDVAKSVPFEARKYIPIPLSEVQLDWAVINVKKNGDQKSPLEKGTGIDIKGPTVEVFFIAVPKEEIKRYQAIMKEAGLTLAALELENFALIRSLLGNDLSPVCIVNIGGRGTSIVIVDNGYQRVNRDYEIGSFEITNAIARSLSVSLKRAEELKKTLGINLSDTNIIKQAIISLLDLMVFEVSKTIHNYEDLKKVKVAKVILVGGLANMPHLIEYFGQKLSCDVVLGNSLARIIVAPGLEVKKSEISSTFAVSIGLGMREIK